MAAGRFQLDQHAVDRLGHGAAQRVHGAGGARAGQATQAQIGKQLGGKWLFGRHHRADHLGEVGIVTGRTGVKQLEIFRRGHDGALAHQGDRSFGERLFPIRP